MLAALVFIPILVWLIRTGGLPYGIYCLVLLGVASFEFFRMGRDPLPPVHLALGLGATLAGPLASMGVLDSGSLSPGSRLSAGALLLASALGMLWDALRGRSAGALQRAGRLALGCLYVGGMGGYLLSLRAGGNAGALTASGAGHSLQVPGWAAVTLAYALTWTNDTGSYVAGLLVGRTPLSSISPSKTREGAVGGFLVTILLGWALGCTVFPWLGAARGVALGALVSVAAQAGDLLESMWKRDLGSKDSARLIPGHGGALDRFDSLFFAAPVLFYFLRWSSLI